MRRGSRQYSEQETSLLERLGKRLLAARKARQWSQETVAERSGLSTSHISKIERGKYQDLQLITVYRMVQALEISFDVLISEEASEAQ